MGRRKSGTPEGHAPEPLLARRHGKGTMSEILEIERRRLTDEARRAMARQLAASGAIPARSGPTNLPTNLPTKVGGGLSGKSRVVGDGLLPWTRVVVHGAVPLTGEDVPAAARAYYEGQVLPTLPFPLQRDLLRALCGLALGHGSFACQLPLQQLAERAGIRNVKTIRKWLDDLQRRGLLEYVPVHGDPRGAVYALTPPADVAATCERAWEGRA